MYSRFSPTQVPIPSAHANWDKSEVAAETRIDSRGVDLIHKEVISAALRGPVGLPSSGALSLHPSTKPYELSLYVGEMAGRVGGQPDARARNALRIRWVVSR